MHEFRALAEEHVDAAAAPVQEARQALEQVCCCGRGCYMFACTHSLTLFSGLVVHHIGCQVHSPHLASNRGVPTDAGCGIQDPKTLSIMADYLRTSHGKNVARMRSQAQLKLQGQQRLSRALPALEAERMQLDAAAEALAKERHVAGCQLEEVQVVQSRDAPDTHACKQS